MANDNEEMGVRISACDALACACQNEHLRAEMVTMDIFTTLSDMLGRSTCIPDIPLEVALAKCDATGDALHYIMDPLSSAFALPIVLLVRFSRYENVPSAITEKITTSMIYSMLQSEARSPFVKKWTALFITRMFTFNANACYEFLKQPETLIRALVQAHNTLDLAGKEYTLASWRAFTNDTHAGDWLHKQDESFLKELLPSDWTLDD